MDGNIQTYRAVDTHGKSQIDLIIQVYDGAILNYRKVHTFFEKEDYKNGHEALEKASRFITHLYTTLDPEKGGEVATNLGKLYAYVLNLTQEASATKEIAKIDDITTILGNLRQGWIGLKEQQKASEQTPETDIPKPLEFSATV